MTLPTTGNYILAIQGNGDAGGAVTYSLEVFENVDPTDQLTLGTEVTGTLGNPGDEHTYAFKGSVGQTLYFDGLTSAPGLYAYLYDPFGNQLFTGEPYYNGISQDEGPLTLPYTGTYTLTVYGGTYYGSYGYTGSYDFVLSATSTAPWLSVNTVVTGTLATGVSTNLYQLSGTAGETLFFDGLSDSPSSSAQAYLYDPANNYVTQFWLEGNVQVTLATTGKYILAVQGVNSAASSVGYSFEMFQNVEPTDALALNSEVTGTLANPGDQHTYTFTGTIGQQVQLNGLSPGSNIVATLIDPEGSAVFYSDLGNNAGPYTLATPGTYELVIAGSGVLTGNYDFRLLDLASETKLQVNTTEADLTVTLSAPATQEVLVQYSTADGTATTAAGDYKAATGLLLFQPGQTSATIELQAVDQFTSANTYFDVDLSGAVGASIAQGTGVVTIEGNGQGTINGEVYNDANGNGTLDGGEPGLAGWTVDLLNASNSVVDTATTDSNGTYSFTSIAPGSYTVAEVLQPGYVQTSPPAAGTYAITLSTGQIIDNLDFGDFQTVTFSGQIFDDESGAGVIASGDPGLAGWTVDLLDSSSALIAQATTDANGDFSFTGVGPGTYTVEQVLQTGYTLTSSPSSYSVKTSSGQGVTGLAFGDFQLATLGGEVFDDANDDGTLDAGDAGLAGWTVNLLNSGQQVIATSTTDSNGDFEFTGVGPGAYTLQELTQPGYTPTTATTFNVTATSGLVSSTDFGEFPIPTLSGEVFNDVSGDGTLEAGDAGLAGWTVELLNSTSAVIATTTTDVNGNYVFTLSAAGTYTVEEVPQTGYLQTAPSSGTFTESVTSGESVAGLDFGNFLQVTYSGEVYNDLNGDGSLDGGEPGLSGWTVNLLNSASAIVATQTTSATALIPSPASVPASTRSKQ